MKLTAQHLIDSLGDESEAAGISIRSRLEPLAGAHAPVKPAGYEGGRYQEDKRWVGEGAESRKVDAIVIDNVASQANRLEASLLRQRDALGLPDLVLDLSSMPLPAHLPKSISVFQMPHRNGDAYLRDASLDGVDFAKSPIGSAILAASGDAPEELLKWMPQCLLYGFWLSHLGKKRAQTKLARSWTSELVGFEPATTASKGHGLKGDALNLSIVDALAYEDDDQLVWEITNDAKKGKKSKDSLAELGHGQVPWVDKALMPISFGWIEQSATCSFAGLRRINCETPAQSAAARALLAAIGLAAHVGAFGRSMSLRSGCELRTTKSAWVLQGDVSDEPIDPISLEEAQILVRQCAAVAHDAGLPVGAKWPAPVTLQPNKNLAKVIAQSWPDLDAE